MATNSIPFLVRGSALALLALAAAGPASAADVDGADVFREHCAVCHAKPSDEKIPTVDALMKLDANRVLTSLTEGSMRLQGETLTADQRTAVAEFLSGGEVTAVTASTANMCKTARVIADPDQQPMWNGWGRTPANTRYQPDTGSITAANVPQLKLKWAFGIPDATQSRAQPTVFAGRLYFGSATGVIYSIDAETGCTYWTHKVGAGVRTAISIGPIQREGASGYAVYFSDAKANAYALDAETGKELWVTKVDTHPAAVATGSPTLYDDVLYVPLTGISEESTSARPDYECCTFRGSITALDATTGKQIWKYYDVPEPKPRGKSSTGAQLWGPSGAGIWSAPTIDAERGLLYAATGNAYSGPPVPTSNAIVAIDLKTGKQVWAKQLLPGDIWIFGCDEETSGGNPDADKNPNCPRNIGPDHDFSASPILTKTPTGNDVLVLTQKSGLGYAIDPERKGNLLWKERNGSGSPKGGVWGAATDGKRAYFSVGGQDSDSPGGVNAVDLATGKRVWFTPPPKLLCEPGQGCSAVQGVAVTAIPGVVFVGSQDGGMRAYSASDGEIIWTYDTNRPFDTVNGIKANGGSIDGPGPVVAGGTVYVTSGNGGFFGRPGNVLLAFTVDGK